jgi:feruloyl esterase
MRCSKLLCAVAALNLVVADDFEQKCTGFAKSINLTENATIWFSEYVSAGTNLSLPDYNVTCGAQYQLVTSDVCRVALQVKTSNRSQISMEAWLPRNWTGRFLSTGNGGISGCIQYPDLDYTSSLGFSTVGANNGYNGTTGEAFYKNEDVVTDFSFRSLHTNVVVGKEISKSFYDKTHKKSYYLGCSTGGRQGFQNVQMFPSDFDGVVAGAPAFNFNNLTSWSGHFYTLLLNAGVEGFPPIDAWPAIHQDILNQCDGLDGYIDGIIEDPLLCNYRPESLICSTNSTNTSTCLTGAQAATVRQIFSPVYGEDGAFVYPRMQPGSELLGDPEIYYSGTSFPFTDGWFRYAVYDDPNWDPATLGPADYSYAWHKDPGHINTWNGNLSAFRDRGGKLLTYHGQQDQIITSDTSPYYYNHVSETMNLPSSSLDFFYRFFRISGMGHCGGGPGAHLIGNQETNSASLDPDENVLMAMVRWVENGTAPDTITGTKWVNDTESAGVAFKRAHCRYPLRNVYKGTGDPTVPESWQCII